ncbi:phosphoribosylaminoimidazolesuccinocarboxamide synthase [Thalassobacillus sp. B23F22_16]|uniref:phosphoribosylaminoimidazolesuccinocarboxamide synthase n=1 Tax=Thalassobacillus sp. B23F22_16 TaxID=3459513 RepID=UPI00373FB23F
MKGSLLYEGKAKKVYHVEGKPEQLVLSYKNDATAFNGKKKDQFEGKGRLNNLITSRIFEHLHQQHIPSHFLKALNDNEQLVQKTTIIPLEVVVRNIAAGSLTRRLAIPEKTVLQPPIIELFYKNDDLDDPLINDDHAKRLANVTEHDLDKIKILALKINEILKRLFKQTDLELVDFKLEFGRLNDGTIVLADEISPDTCRLWDAATGEKMDKDVFREDIGDLIATYETILQRLEESICAK